MNIQEFDYDKKVGFAWIVLEDGNIVQCCTHRQSAFDEIQIVKNHCCHNWGICGEVNQKAFDDWGENRCMKALFAKAEQNGIEVI